MRNDLGLAPGIPVVGGTPDVQSAAIGFRRGPDYEGHLYIGTSSWITCHVPAKKTDILRNIAALPSPLPGKYYRGRRAGVGRVVRQLAPRQRADPEDALRETPVPADVYARIDALAASAPTGAGGVIFTPWLNGERTPVDDDRLRGGWHNLSLRTTCADLGAAVLEGVVFNSRWLLDVVEKFVGRPFHGLNFVGGGAESDVWCQILADVLDRPIRHGARRACEHAWRGVARLRDAEAAHGRRHRPRGGRPVRLSTRSEHRAVYDTAYKEFRALYKQNKSIYARLNRHG